MADEPMIGAVGERTLTVTEEHTAARWGSGSLAVLATPAMIALMEGAAVAAVDAALPKGYATVGTRLDVRHLAATPLGGTATARARLTTVDGRRLTFAVEAWDDAGPIGEGEHERYIIDVARFLARAANRLG
jgi:predicted thioesterase